MSIQNSEIKLSVKGKAVNAYLSRPANGGPGILLLHAWWGLKPFFKQVCDRLAEEGFVVLAPDLYQGDIAKTIEEAKVFHAKHENEFMGDIVKAAKDYLTAFRPGKPIGVMGFSMGAAWAIITMTKEPDVAATVLFYGAYSPDFSKTKSKVLGHFSDNDEWEPIEGVREMETNLKAAGVDTTLHVYPNVHHWFMEEDRPEYDPKAAKLAWARTIEFLKKNVA
jgi:carboxymethylenebutenolidase